MRFLSKTPKLSLNPAFKKQKPQRTEIDTFKIQLIALLDSIDEKESEEFHKNLVSDFLKNSFYKDRNFINTKDKKDLVIHTGIDNKTPVGVIIEAKRPKGNENEMFSLDKPNAKALHELILYYFEERHRAGNSELKYLVITNIYQWFLFDANEFDKHVYRNTKIKKLFDTFINDHKDKPFFYEELKKLIPEIDAEFSCTYFDLHKYEKNLRNEDNEDDNELRFLYKILSPFHLLKVPFANDSNSLDKVFYSELLYILGLGETKDGGKKIIQRLPAESRNAGSLLENTISQLDSHDKLSRLPNFSQYGNTYEERLFTVALELVITWMNRILFLKLLEAQLLTYHKGNKAYAFLNKEKINDYDELDKLFFRVLAKKIDERDSKINIQFGLVPYLNSSLFEPTEIEQLTLFINGIENAVKLPLYSNTVLKNDKGKKRTYEMESITYLFEFLNAYDFSSDGSGEIQEDNKTLINASVLGLIFEKINGYKDGSFFTPGFITMYMCRETIRRAIIQKFNEKKGWDTESISELYDKIGNKKEDRIESNTIINSLHICDPAVGSGHFLVSALNEIIAIKSDLRILSDRDGTRLKEYTVIVENDELVITDEDGGLFEYQPHNKESQRVQETLFHEKQTIIENCLFGVDINPNSVKICRLRLWVELLKNAYYKTENGKSELETLPNIDINIKCGNSLISRFPLDADLKQTLKKSKWNIDSYKLAVETYRHAQNKEEKREMEQLITDIKSDFRSEISKNDPKLSKLYKLKGDLTNLTTQQNIFGMSDKEKKEWNKKVEIRTGEIDKLETEIEEIKSNKIYENAFEWRFEYPEVLNNNGDFVGFDVVIGNPPYIVLSSFEGNEFKYIQETYSTSYGRINTFATFTERITTLLRDKGNCSIIIPDSLCLIDYYSALRKYLLDKTNIIEIIELGDGVFEEAVVPAIIFSFNNHYRNENKIKIGFKNNLITGKDFKYIKQNYYLLTPKFSFNLHIDSVFVKLQSLIKEMKAERLEQISTIKIGICTGDNKRHISNSEIFDVSKKVLQGRDINRYSLHYAGLYVNYNKKELLRSREESIFLKGEKLLMRQTSDKLILTYDNNQYYTIDSLFLIFTNNEKINLKYLLALLNSTLLNSQYQKLNPEKGRVFAQVKIDYVNELPIIVADSQVQQDFQNLVDSILTIKNNSPETDTKTLEKQIDAMVYKLYGLTEEEIKIVEGAL
jgi:adenine-specific DNA-methyltransferase